MSPNFPDYRIPITVMIGAGSKLPALIKASLGKNSQFYISLVASHKADSWGVKYSLENKIAAVYFKLPDYRNRIFVGAKSARSDYMKRLGWFISQREYNPALLVFAGWDLIMDKNFFNFFKCDFGEGYAAINLHPALMPIKGEKDKIVPPDGTTIGVIKGEQGEVLKTVLARKLSYFGPSVHFMVADKYDIGEVIKREFIKVSPKDTVQSLRRKLMPVEDKILVEAINEVIDKYILTTNH